MEANKEARDEAVTTEQGEMLVPGQQGQRGADSGSFSSDSVIWRMFFNLLVP